MKYAAAVAAVFAGDFFLKEHVEQRRGWNEETELLGGRIVWKKYHNRGAALNCMEKRPGLVKQISGMMLLILGILWFFFFRKKENPAVLLGLSLVLGGGGSNYYDRLRRGYVVDYFSFRTPWKWLNQIIFNISDLCIFLGLFMAVLAESRRSV